MPKLVTTLKKQVEAAEQAVKNILKKISKNTASEGICLNLP
jgi:hypothetical protein